MGDQLQFGRLLRVKAFESVLGTTPAVSAGGTVLIPATKATTKMIHPKKAVAHLGGWQPAKPVSDRSTGPEISISCLLNGLAHCYLLCDRYGLPTTTDAHGASTWASQHAYAQNAYVQPAVKNGYVYKCVTAGTSGLASPAWPTTINAQVTDGTAVWACHSEQTFQHVWKHGAPPVGASYEAGNTEGAIYNVLAGMRCTGAKYKFGDTGGIEADFSYRGLSATPGTVSLDSAPTIYADEPFDLATAVVKCGGLDISGGALQSLDIDAARGVGTPFYPMGGGGLPTSMPLKKSDFKGTSVWKFEDWARYTAAMAGTPSSFEIITANGTGDGTPGNEYCSHLFPEVVFEARTPDQVSDDGIIENIAFWAYCATNAEQTAHKVTVKNTIASFA